MKDLTRKITFCMRVELGNLKGSNLPEPERGERGRGYHEACNLHPSGLCLKPPSWREGLLSRQLPFHREFQAEEENMSLNAEWLVFQWCVEADTVKLLHESSLRDDNSSHSSPARQAWKIQSAVGRVDVLCHLCNF
uniref:Uncharacterized protein n=1 Tax=Pipistrellus kuhlii TaxID=59472 RepID=A0A7J7XBP2_PIPKU|nr:hypothetical protein mPipKuh1_010652 [Pipistrellus kuhlii]